MTSEETPDGTQPPVPPAAGGDKTVIASPDALAAALGGQAPPPASPPMADASASVPPLPPVMPQFVAAGPGGADALVGVQLNDLFEVVRFIAEGGMGRVYEGRNIASGERVAIKVILGQYAADEQFMALFRREASALEKIGHDALVKYRALAFDRARNVNYLAIEYVDGPSMAHVLTGQKADPAQVKRVLRRLAQGLHTAHELGVIHRDLSPDNVLLPGGNIERAKIIDFGIAKDNNPGAKSVVGEAFAGKFGYAAPEVFGKFGRRIGAWTDIYSLGLVIAAFARGTAVDMGITIVDALEAREKVPDLSDLAPDLQAIIGKMLAPDPAQRFQTMEEVADACDPRGATQFLGSGSTTAAGDAPAFVKADTAPPVADKPNSRMPMPAVAAVAVAVLAGLGWLALKPDGSADDKPAEIAAPVPAEASAPAPAETGLAAVANAADWATSAPQVHAALKALRCADVRIDGMPQGGRVRLTGWRAATSPLPSRVGAWQLDGSAVQAVSAPSATSCQIVDQLRAAAQTSPEHGFHLPGSRQLALASLQRGLDGYVHVDLNVSGRPPGRLLVTSIDDRTTRSSERVVSGDVDDLGGNLATMPFDPKPGRYLMVLVAAPAKLPEAIATGPAPGMAAACAGGGCQLTSGWIEMR